MADYPISNVPRRVQYVNTGVGPYLFNFEILTQTDIAVYRGNSLLTLTTDYTVSINSNGTGSVTLTTAGTGNITIVGARAIQRASDYTTNGDLFANTLNTDLDSQTIYSQQLAETLDRTIKVPITDASTLNMQLPISSTRANKIFGFDSNGQSVVTSTTVTQLDAAVSSFVNATGNNASSILYDPFGSGAVQTTVQAKLRESINVKDFGAVGDGITDDTVAIQAAINSLPAGGGVVYFDVGTYVVSSTIQIGDGTNSARSTKAGISLIGRSGGVGAGEFGTPNSGTRILWNGATNTTTPVILMNGPIHSCVMEQLVIDCNAKAGRGIELQHPYQCRFTDVQVERYTTRGWMLVSRTAVISGVTQGAFDNTFINCHSRDPASSAAETGLYMDGGDANNIGCSRNTFINCLWLIAGDSGTRAIYLGFVDNNQFIRCTTAWAGATQLGVGIYAVGSVTNPGFPLENVFDGCSILGGYTVGSGTTGHNMFIPYMLGDGQPDITIDGKIKALYIDGRLRGGWAGSACTLSGFADAGTGLPADNTTRYFSFSGYNTTTTTATGNQVTLMPVGGRVCRLRVYCDTAPGAAGSGKIRTFTLFKNGVTTGFEVTFTNDQVGDRAVTSVAGISFNGGDRLELRVFGTNTPALTQASWSIYYYPEEVI